MGLGNFSDDFSSAKEKLDAIHLQHGEGAVIKKRAHVVRETQWFTYEVWIRHDHTVIVHLKDLYRAFQQKRAMDALSAFVVNRIGAHDSAYADWVGNVMQGSNSKSTQLNSIDIFIDGYVPARLLDDKEIIKQFEKICDQLVEFLNVNAGSLI